MNAKRNSIENQFQCSHAELVRVALTRTHEPTVLEPLCEHAETSAIPKQQLEKIAAAIEEREEGPRKGILAQSALHEPHQAIKRATHVDGVPVRQDPSRLTSPLHPSPSHPRGRAVWENDIDRPATTEAIEGQTPDL
jgi:hypothetical protein